MTYIETPPKAPVLHRRDAFDGSARRIMHRTRIKGGERIA